MLKVMIGLTIAVLVAAFFVFCCDWSSDGMVRGAKYDPRTMSGGRIVVPETATDIELVNEIFWTRLKCVVDEKDVMNYAAQRGWRLHSDTLSFNERARSDTSIDYSVTARTFFDGAAGRERPKRYLSYNYILPNNGGWTMLYNCNTRVLYVEYANH